MKKGYLFILLVSVIITGCSSIYTVKDFSSKKNFYDDFNKFARNKNLKVTLTNDSTFAVEGKTRITNDSLLMQMNIQKEVIIKRDEVKDIKYYGKDMSKLSAIIILKDGTTAKAKNLNILADSSISIAVSKSFYKSLPLGKIKKISYKNLWFTLPLGFLIGTAVGTGIGGAISSYDAHHNMGSAAVKNEYLLPLIYGALLGMVSGSVASWIIGHNYIYEFNP